jgi:hypothetical protein
MKPFSTIYDEFEANMIIGSEYHQYASSIEGNEGDLSNAVIFYKWWMERNGMWKNNIKLKTTWE